MDIKESKEILEGLLSGVDAIAKAKEDDGEITIKDFPKFLPVIPKMVSALKDAQKIKDELKELSPEEMEELLNMSFELAMKVGKVIFGVDVMEE